MAKNNRKSNVNTTAASTSTTTATTGRRSRAEAIKALAAETTVVPTVETAPAVETKAKRVADPAVKAFDPMVRANAAQAQEIFKQARSSKDGISREEHLTGKGELPSKIAWRMMKAGLLIRTQIDRAADKDAGVAAKKNVDSRYVVNPDASPEVLAMFSSLK